eukprot:1144682-Pelagomonas_calceolata.AAC.2
MSRIMPQQGSLASSHASCHNEPGGVAAQPAALSQPHTKRHNEKLTMSKITTVQAHPFPAGALKCCAKPRGGAHS